MNLKPLLKRQKLRVDPHGHSESLWDARLNLIEDTAL